MILSDSKFKPWVFQNFKQAGLATLRLLEGQVFQNRSKSALADKGSFFGSWFLVLGLWLLVG